MNDLEQVLQIISIIVFVSGGITFFFKTGGYKTNVDTKLETLTQDVKDNELAIKKIQDDIEKMKDENTLVTSRLETVLIEIKTKLELLMQFSGWKNNEKD